MAADPGAAGHRRFGRRTVLVAGGGVLAAGAVGALGLSMWDPYRTPRRLPKGTYTPPEGASGVGVGGLHVDLSSGLTVTLDGALLWRAHGPFLAAAHASLTWRDIAGHFTSTMAIESVHTELQVTRAVVVADTVHLAGTLGRRGDPIAWTASLRDRHGRLALDVDVPDADLVVLRGELAEGEGVHGLGAQFAPFDLRGLVVPVVTREQGVGRGAQPLTTLAELTSGAGGSPTCTYAPVPSLVTDALRGIDLHHDEYCRVDLRGGRIELGVWARTLRLEAYAAADPPALLARRHDRMGALPEWSLRGGILGVQGGTDAVRRKVSALLDHPDGAPLAGVWIQDWVGRRDTGFGSRLWWTWELDEEHYPGWDDLTAELATRGVRTLTYVNPFLVDPRDKPSPVARDLFAEAADLGHLVRDASGGPYLLNQGGFDAALVDLTRPEARKWFAEVITRQVAPRASGGWMADFGEGLPFDAVLAEGDPATMHNRWPTLWAELNAHVRDAVGGDRLVFHRSAGRGTARVAGAFWAGDQLVGFDEHDGMESALRGVLAGGVSGLTLNHTDTGGYTALSQPVVGVRRSAEVLVRWAEWSAWTPLFRTHEGNRPQECLQAYDEAARDGVAEQLRVFAALADYRAGVVAEVETRGLPALRHCWVHHRGTRAARRDDQYTFGERFLVAPVFAADAEPRVVTLPPGEWVHLWTGEVYAGDADVRPGHRRLPVFHRRDDAPAAAVADRVRAVVRE